MTLPKTYTLNEVAEAMGMSPRWVRDRIKDGAVCIRAGRKIRFTEEHYEALRDSLTVAPASKGITTGRKQRA